VSCARAVCTHTHARRGGELAEGARRLKAVAPPPPPRFVCSWADGSHHEMVGLRPHPAPSVLPLLFLRAAEQAGGAAQKCNWLRGLHRSCSCECIVPCTGS
jgi:hypothetical protein